MPKFKYSMAALAIMSALSADALTVGTLRTQYLPEPIGIDNIKVTFSVASLPCALYLVTVTDTDGAKRTVKLMKR